MSLSHNGLCVRPVNSTQTGFTVIEILITLSLIVIGLSLAFPSLQALSAKNQVAAASNVIVSGLNLARSSAITSGQDTTICPTADGESCGEASWGSGWIVFNDADSDGNIDAGEMIRVVTFESPQIASGFDDLIVFQSNGMTSLAADAVIVSCAPNSNFDHCLEVTVSAFGMIKSGSHTHVSSGNPVPVI